MHMPIPLRVRGTVSRCLVHARRIREAALEKIVITSRQLFDDIRQINVLCIIHIIQTPQLTLTQDKSLERPSRPKRYHRDKSVVLTNDAIRPL